MDFWVFTASAPVFEQLLSLRYQVMRQPLGLEFSPQELSMDTMNAHIGAFINNELIACCVMHHLDSKTIKMRQLAVYPQHQKKTYGKQLVCYAEKWAKYAGYQKIILHARDYAIPFYEKLGYLKEGEPFTEIQILHIKMFKNI
ncbi:MAG: GNAT family N-acetyltransferase [Bacteroidia bacterium]|nr:GNAT family N-acetyltransferase [Bacteroidia bacterium]